MFKRIVTAAIAAVLALAASAPAVHAQKALVYCPVGIDAAGCDRIVTALQPKFTDGIDRGYDGSNGTVDLTKIDLHHYGVFVVPSLADDATKQPYALLRSVAPRLHFAITGRVAVYSGAPDLGNSNRSDKDALIQNLATWAANGHSRATGLVGLVAFLDLSEHAADRYSWVRDISLTDVSADAQLTAFSDVQAVSARGTSVLSAGGRSVRFTNMASFGLHIGRHASARTEVGALGGTSGAQSVLVMYSNADGKDGATTGSSTGQLGSTGASLDVSGVRATLSTTSTTSSTASTTSTSGPTLTTDKADYLPGDTVTFTGTGFAPGDTVTITVHEDPTWSYPDRQFTSIADANGAFTNRDMVVATQDLGVTFTATAVGNPSGDVAQTTFTDGNSIVSGRVTDAVTHSGISGATVSCSTGCNGNPPPSTTTSSSGTYSFQVTYGGSNGGSVGLTVTATGYQSQTATVSLTTGNQSTGSHDFALTPIGPTKLGFATTAFTSTVGACFGPITTQTQDANGTATNTVSPTIVSLTTDDGGTGAGAFYDSNACSSAITSITIANGANSGSFYYKATARGSGSHSLNAAATGLTSANQTETINRADQATLSATAPTAGTYGDHLTMTATGGSGTGALSFAVIAGSTACSIVTTQPDSGKLAITSGAGTCSITATKAQDNDYNSATSAPLTVTISKKTVTVATLTASNKTYNGTNAATLTGGTLSGVLASDEVNVGLDISSATATFADANAGTSKLVTATGLGLNGSASGNYVLNPTTATTTANIDQLALVASITASGKEYDGTTTVTGTVGCTVATKIGTDDVGCSATGAVFGSANAGSETVTANVALTGTTKGNYTLGAQTTATVSATISQKALTITAANQEKTYDGSPFTGFTATYAGLIATDATNGLPNAGVLSTAVTFGGPAATAVNAGSYSIDPSGATATNYSITFASGTLKIDQATAVLNVSGFTGPYDGSAHAGSCTATGVNNAAVTTTPSYAPGGSAAPVNAGSYTLTCSITGQQNYKDASAPAAIEIDKVTLTVKADDKSKTYDGSVFTPFTSTITGFVNNESSTLVGGAVTYTGTAVAATNAGSYTITPVVTGLSATNYGFSPANGTLSIKQAALTITADDKEKTYDGLAFTAFTANYNGLIAADQVSNQPKAGVLSTPVTFGGDAATAVNAGTYSIVPSGATAINYAITFANGSLKIGKATASIHVIGYTVDYDGHAHTATGTATGVGSPGADLSAQLTLTGTSHTDAGTYNDTWNFSGGTNYLDATGPVTDKINQVMLTVTAPSFTVTYGDPIPSPINPAIVGFIGNESASNLTTTPSCTTSYTTSSDAGSTQNTDCSGGVATNYSFKYVNGTVTVNQATAVINVNGYTGTYDGNGHGATGTATGIKSENLGSLLHLGSSFTNVPGGTASWTFDGNTNYKPATGSVSITISKADPAITVSGYSGTFDWNPHGASGSAAGVKGEALSGLDLGASYTNAPGGTAYWSFNDLTGNYNNKSGSVAISIAKATPQIDWMPTTVSQGSQFGNALKTATASLNSIAVGGTFSYSIPDGFVLVDASYPATASFTPTTSQNFNSASATRTITVSNVAPGNLTINLPSPVAVKSALTVTGGFTDPGGAADLHVVTLTWYLGSSLVTGVPSETQAIVTYNGTSATYSANRSDLPAGVYTVEVKVTDRYNGDVTGDAQYAVVYDPSGGFVTGGGWIVADDGSCVQANAPDGVCANATGGRANFGFVSKYQKGATVPSGDTQFQFQAGNLNLKSTSYQWLVISGPQAQYKGTGTINGGSTSYNFILTAVDGAISGGGGLDKFRIKITDLSGNVVFDNMKGQDDSTTPTTALGGGDISIKSK